jgi:hypothetical protein
MLFYGCDLGISLRHDLDDHSCSLFNEDFSEPSPSEFVHCSYFLLLHHHLTSHIFLRIYDIPNSATHFCSRHPRSRFGSWVRTTGDNRRHNIYQGNNLNVGTPAPSIIRLVSTNSSGFHKPSHKLRARRSARVPVRKCEPWFQSPVSMG